jgi:hypothetical protein
VAAQRLDLLDDAIAEQLGKPRLGAMNSEASLQFLQLFRTELNWVATELSGDRQSCCRG